jgi:16S rRNA (adenine1518-N6/adenine1519-N6)-dimethyltransferase
MLALISEYCLGGQSVKVKQVLDQLEIIPTKRRGQNFLLNSETAKSIVDFAKIPKDAAVIEIGPGLGALTEQILKHTKRFAIIEIEQKFCEFLKQTYPDLENIYNTSFVEVELEAICKQLSTDQVYLISNVPYSISSELFLWLINNRKYFNSASLLFQREFAERLAAKPGSREYGSLSVMCETFTNHKLGSIISGASFYPSAEVESRLIKVEICQNPKFEIADQILFEKIVRAAFSHRRKTIFNSLKSSSLSYSAEQIKLFLEQAGFDPIRRAETFSAQDYAKLTASFLS